MPAKKKRPKTTKAKKATAKKTTASKASTRKKASAKKAPAKAPVKGSRRAAGSVTRTKNAAYGRPGDHIVIDSAKVGSPTREGKIVKVIQGELRVSYWVMWGDGHESLVSPAAGTARIVRS